MNVTIRKGTESDLEATLNLVKELAVYEKALHEVTVTLDDYKADFKNNVFKLFVAELNNEIVGITFYYQAYSTWKGKMLYLDDFVVKKELRGRGIGRKLFKNFIQEAKEQNASLASWQVLDWNTPAIDFYIKNNAKIEKEWFNGKIYKSQFDEVISNIS